ncbi:MAG: hypothetical protein RSE23_13745, partial [Clostridia bacterium]
STSSNHPIKTRNKFLTKALCCYKVSVEHKRSIFTHHDELLFYVMRMDGRRMNAAAVKSTGGGTP